jgi:hypothetical protein
MHLLVISKVSFPATNRYLPDWDEMRALGHTVSINESYSKPDAILCMSVSVMEEAWVAIAKWPESPLFCYNWDCYSWVWIRPRPGEYDYHRYGDLLRHAVEIWVPSDCTGQQTSLWWSLFNWKVIHSICPAWDYEYVRDDGFVLCPLRRLPDHWCGMFEVACKELNIPYKMTNHGLKWLEYQDLVASCRFLVSHFQEASTGGLTLLEGYAFGKHVLISDSRWNGAGEYFGNRGNYFRHGDFDHFKCMLELMYRSPHPMPDDHRQWVRDTFSDQKMVKDIEERIYAYIG